MISQIDIEDFGPIRKASLKLTPLHALIGPNDSGKSSLLRAIEAIVNLKPDARAGAACQTRITAAATTWDWIEVTWTTANGAIGRYREMPDRSIEPGEPATLCAAIGPCRYVQFDPDRLGDRSQVLKREDVLAFPLQRGHELAGVLDYLKDQNDDKFAQLDGRVQALFPSVKRLFLGRDNSQKVVGVRTTTGAEVVGSAISAGLLTFVAYLTISAVTGAKILLVEEPENGLHPARIRDVVGVLRNLSENGVQVIMATHSPLVVNELLPEEVTVVTRTPEYGTVLTPLRDTPNFELRSKAYALGELWLAYADGSCEAPLLETTSPDASGADAGEAAR